MHLYPSLVLILPRNISKTEGMGWGMRKISKLVIGECTHEALIMGRLMCFLTNPHKLTYLGNSHDYLSGTSIYKYFNKMADPCELLAN